MTTVSGDSYTRMGEDFGNGIAGLVGSVRQLTVTVSSTDEDFAYCYIYEDDVPLPVPLTFLNISSNSLKITPTTGSLAVISFANGDENQPVFINFSSIDKIEFIRSKSSLTWEIDPEDDMLDTLNIAIGKLSLSFQIDQLEIKLGKSNLRIVENLIEMNDGSLGGLVTIGLLTSRLNKMQREINKIQQSIKNHQHTYIDSVGQAAVPTNRTTRTNDFINVELTEVKDDDYVNKKITQ